jgi:hypothetical protein
LLLTLRDKQISRVSENIVLRTIFGHKKQDVTGQWMKLCCEDFHNFGINNIYYIVNTTLLPAAGVAL